MSKGKGKAVNQRSSGGNVEPTGGKSPRDLGDTKGNDATTKRHEVSLVPGDKGQFDQHHGVAPDGGE